MAELTITFEVVWKKKKTDLSECYGCGDIIYSDVYSPFIRGFGDDFRIDEICFCQSCRGAIKDN